MGPLRRGPARSSSSSTAARVVRNTGVRLLAELLSKLALLALFAVFARHLGPGDLGDFVLAVSLAFLVTTLGGVGIDEIVAREVGRDPDQLPVVVWNALAVKLAVGVAAVGVAVTVGVVGGRALHVLLTLALVAASACVDLLAATLYSAFQGLNDLRPEAVARTLQSWVRAILGIAALLAGGGIAALAGVYLLTSIAALVVVSRRLRADMGHVPRQLATSTARGLVLAGLPIALGALFEIVVLNVDTVIISAMKGSDAVGLFGAATRLVEGTLVLASSFVAAVVPVLVRAGRSGPSSMRGHVEVATKGLALALVPVSLAFMLFPEPLIRLFFGPGFVAATTTLRILGATVVLHGVSQLAFSALIAAGRQRVIPWIAAVAAVEDIVLTLLLVPRHSIDGAALATFVAAFTYASLAIGATVRLCGVLSLRRILLAPACGAGVMVGVALALGRSVGAAVVAVAGYSLAVVAIEHFSRSYDLAWAVSVLGSWSRGGVEPLTGGSEGPA